MLLLNLPPFSPSSLHAAKWTAWTTRTRKWVASALSCTLCRPKTPRWRQQTTSSLCSPRKWRRCSKRMRRWSKRIKLCKLLCRKRRKSCSRCNHDLNRLRPRPTRCESEPPYDSSIPITFSSWKKKKRKMLNYYFLSHSEISACKIEVQQSRMDAGSKESSQKASEKYFVCFVFGNHSLMSIIGSRALQTKIGQHGTKALAVRYLFFFFFSWFSGLFSNLILFTAEKSRKWKRKFKARRAASRSWNKQQSNSRWVANSHFFKMALWKALNFRWLVLQEENTRLQGQLAEILEEEVH